MPGLRNIREEPLKTGLPVARIVADGDQIGLFEFARFHRLTDNIAGHHFGQTGRVAAGVGIVFSQYLARVVIDKDPGFGVNLRGARDHRFDIQVIGAAAEESAATESAVMSKRAVKEVFMVRTTASVMELKSALL